MEEVTNNRFVLGKYLLNPGAWLDWAVRTGLILGTVLVWLCSQVLFGGYQISVSAPDEYQQAPTHKASSR